KRHPRDPSGRRQRAHQDHGGWIPRVPPGRADPPRRPRRGSGDPARAPRIRPRRPRRRAAPGGAVGGRALRRPPPVGPPRRGRRILVPSGAIGGLDAVKGAREGAISAVTMETRKPPRGLQGAPYIVEHAIDLDAIAEETLVFEGAAADAVRAFPANVNVVAA